MENVTMEERIDELADIAINELEQFPVKIGSVSEHKSEGRTMIPMLLLDAVSTEGVPIRSTINTGISLERIHDYKITSIDEIIECINNKLASK